MVWGKGTHVALLDDKNAVFKVEYVERKIGKKPEKRWVEVSPVSERAQELARLGNDGKLWFRQEDLQEVPDPRQGTLT